MSLGTRATCSSPPALLTLVHINLQLYLVKVDIVKTYLQLYLNFAS